MSSAMATAIDKQKILDNLDPDQRAAVTHADGPLLVIACPGAGKTRVITHRIAWLLACGVSPRQILALAFTRRAAQEMRDRIAALCGNSRDLANMWIRTFHSASLAMISPVREELRLEQAQIADARKARHVLSAVVTERNLPYDSNDLYRLSLSISKLKEQGVTASTYSEYAKTPDDQGKLSQSKLLMAELYSAYQKELRNQNLLDFGDMQLLAEYAMRRIPKARRIWGHRFTHILVDEFQDLSPVQYRILRYLAGPRHHVCVVGDPDQAIYAFRGGSSHHIYLFRKHYRPREIVLARNYRSIPEVVETATRLISLYPKWEARPLHAVRGASGVAVRMLSAPDPEAEAEEVVRDIAAHGLPRAGQTTAILYRVRAQGRAFEEVMIRHKMPYTIAGGSWYTHADVQTMHAIVKLVVTDTAEGMVRAMRAPTRGLGRKSCEVVEDTAARLGMGVGEALRRLGQGTIPGLRGPQRQAALELVEVLAGCRAELERGAPVDERVHNVLDKWGYIEYVEADTDDDEPDSGGRADNLDEFLHLASRYETLQQFVESVDRMIARSTHARDQAADGVVQLSTIHAAKGAEMNHVYVVGLEAGLMPHARARGDEVEEERRVMYVGLTRAIDRLVLSYCCQRRGRAALPSPYIAQIGTVDQGVLRPYPPQQAA